jgi:hypothetical protein
VKTYLLIWFSSEGARPSEINQRLLSLGFKSMQGTYDFVYDWNSNVDIDKIFEFGDKVYLSLQGSGVMFKMETM